MKTILLTLLSALALNTAAQTRRTAVVADSLSRLPLAGASVFDADSRDTVPQQTVPPSDSANKSAD